MQLLNIRYLNGGGGSMTSDDDLEHSGVLLRQFDMLEDAQRPWLPCPLVGANSWCRMLANRWSASIIHSGAHALHSSSSGGLVLSARVELLCAYASDGDSMHAARSCAADVSVPPVDLIGNLPDPIDDLPDLVDDLPDGPTEGGVPNPKVREASSAGEDSGMGANITRIGAATIPATRGAEEGHAAEEVKAVAEAPEAAVKNQERAARFTLQKATGDASSGGRVLPWGGGMLLSKSPDGSCIPGCYPKELQCYGAAWWQAFTPQSAGAYSGCSFPPDQLATALHAQLDSPQLRALNNEVVVSTASIVQGLPASIRAFFYLATSTAKEIGAVQRAHAAFVADLGLQSTPELAPPLLLLDLQGGADDAPFSVAQLDLDGRTL